MTQKELTALMQGSNIGSKLKESQKRIEQNGEIKQEKVAKLAQG